MQKILHTFFRRHGVAYNVDAVTVSVIIGLVYVSAGAGGRSSTRRKSRVSATDGLKSADSECATKQNDVHVICVGNVCTDLH